MLRKENSTLKKRERLITDKVKKFKEILNRRNELEKKLLFFKEKSLNLSELFDKLKREFQINNDLKGEDYSKKRRTIQVECAICQTFRKMKSIFLEEFKSIQEKYLTMNIFTNKNKKNTKTSLMKVKSSLYSLNFIFI